MSLPVVSFGQSSTQIALAIDKLHRKLRKLDSPYSSCDNNANVYVDSSPITNQFPSKYDVFTLQGYSTSYSEDDKSVQQITNRILKLYENGDASRLQCIAFISDIGLGSALSAAVHGSVSTLIRPSVLGIHTLPMAPETISGINVLNSILSLQASFEYSNGVMIRGYEEINNLLNGVENSASSSGSSTSAVRYSGGLNDQTSVKDIQNALATDIYMAICRPQVLENSQADLHGGLMWPLNLSTLSPTSKLFDVRTSLWKLESSSKKLANIPYNPLRAMATNLHALHLLYSHEMAGLYGTGRSKFVAANANIIVDNATLVDIALSAYAGSGSTKSGGGEISISRTSCKGNEVDVALKWAAPSVDFPNTDGQLGQQLLRDARSGVIMHKQLGSDDSSTASAKNATSRQPPSGNPFESSGPAKVCALAFNSPYSKYLVHDICNKAVHLVEKGAFLHHFDSYTADDFVDAIESVLLHVQI